MRVADGVETKQDAWRQPALLAGAVLLGWLLGHAARWFADGLAVNAQLYFHAFRLSFVHSPWVLAPLRFLSGAVLQHSALASWSFACGYCCVRAARASATAPAAALVIVSLIGTLLTTTSVRGAQPQFFDSMATRAIYPLGVTMLFVVIPIGLAARCVRERASSLPAVGIAAAISVTLAWWHAADLGHALTFGCTFASRLGGMPCVPPAPPWGIIAAAVLSVLSVLMVWDVSSA